MWIDQRDMHADKNSETNWNVSIHFIGLRGPSGMERAGNQMVLSPVGGGAGEAQWLAYLLPYPAAPGSIPRVPKKISDEIFFIVADVNQWCCLDESGQLIEPR